MIRMSGTASTLRLARPADASGIALLSRDQIEHGLGWKYDAPTVARLIADVHTSALVADSGRGVDGFAIMQFADESAHLLLLAVQPRQRRRGIARQLLQWLLDSARTAGIAEVHLELRQGNAGARAFYSQFGFVDAALVPGYYQQREAALRMRLRLRSDTETPPRWQAPTLNRP